MVSLVTLEQVRRALRIGDTGDSPIEAHEDDGRIEDLLIPGASAAVIHYLGSQGDTVIPGLADTPQTSDGVPEEVQIAVIDVIRVLYDDASEEEKRRIEQGYLPPAATMLLYPLRDPALA